MKIAVITGASSGLGRRFAETVDRCGSFDQIWVIARRESRLRELKLPFPAKVIPLDLSRRDSYDAYRQLLEQEQPEIGLLVNASGFGKFGATKDFDLDVHLNMVDLNCQAVQALCQLSLPYMQAGSRILNIASVAALQPIPYINVYAASKAFVLSYSRGLNRELRKQGVTVTAVCPYWTKTEFFDRAVSKEENAVVKYYNAMYDPAKVVERAWRDALRGRDVSKYGFVARVQAALVKLAPHRFVMWYWMKQQKLD